MARVAYANIPGDGLPLPWEWIAAALGMEFPGKSRAKHAEACSRMLWRVCYVCGVF